MYLRVELESTIEDLHPHLMQRKPRWSGSIWEDSEDPTVYPTWYEVPAALVRGANWKVVEEQIAPELLTRVRARYTELVRTGQRTAADAALELERLERHMREPPPGSRP